MATGILLELPADGLYRVEVWAMDGKLLGDMGWAQFSAGSQWIAWPGAGLGHGFYQVRVRAATGGETLQGFLVGDR